MTIWDSISIRKVGRHQKQHTKGQRSKREKAKRQTIVHIRKLVSATATLQNLNIDTKAQDDK